MTHENSDNVVLLDDNVESDHIVLLENNVKSDHIDYVPSGQAIELTADKILDKKLEGWLIEIDDEEEGRGYEPDEPYYQETKEDDCTGDDWWSGFLGCDENDVDEHFENQLC